MPKSKGTAMPAPSPLLPHIFPVLWAERGRAIHAATVDAAVATVATEEAMR